MTHDKKNEHKIVELAGKWQDGTITEAERLIFNQWFYSFDDSAAHHKATPDRREKIFAAIEKMKLAPGPVKPAGLRRAVWLAAAAVIILVVSAIVIMYHHSAKQVQVAQQHPSKMQRHTATITNDTGLSKTIQLQDGSTVTLSRHSTVSWQAPFSDTARDLTLTGEAMFKVAKDVNRPFTVYANGIATTAVGTWFTVKTVSPDVVNVTLMEGRVVIQPADSSVKVGAGKIFLNPGQECSINKRTSRYLVKNTRLSGMETITNGGNNIVKHPVGNNVRLVFNNDPLAIVLNQLTTSYKKEIRFNEQDLTGLYFSGMVLKSDSLKRVLSVICNMNQLAFTEEKGVLQIRKSN